MQHASAQYSGSSPQAPQSAFDRLMDQLHGLPLWLKQAVYVELKDSILTMVTPDTMLLFTRENAVQLWYPELTRQGILQVHNPSPDYPRAIHHLLNLIHRNANVINITLASQWTLKQTCLVLQRALELELVQAPEQQDMAATIRYLAGESLLGEYLVDVYKLTPERRQEALMTQKYIQDAMGEHVYLGDVLISLGFVTPEDSESILMLKQECEKPYEMVNGIPRVERQQAVQRIHKTPEQQPSIEEMGNSGYTAAPAQAKAMPVKEEAISPELMLPPPPAQRLSEKPTSFSEQQKRNAPLF